MFVQFCSGEKFDLQTIEEVVPTMQQEWPSLGGESNAEFWQVKIAFLQGTYPFIVENVKMSPMLSQHLRTHQMAQSSTAGRLKRTYKLCP